MSQNLALETAIAQLPAETQYLVRECAHQVKEVLNRYNNPHNNPHLVGLALELLTSQVQESIKY